MRLLLLATLLLHFSSRSYAQHDVLAMRVSLKVKQVLMKDVLKKIGEQTGVTFSYSADLIPDVKISFHARREPLNSVLVRLLHPRKLTYLVLYGNHIVITRQQRQAQQFTVSGQVRNAASGEKLSGVSVLSLNDLRSAQTDQDGLYSLSLYGDSVQLLFSLSGYVGRFVSLNLNKDTVLDVRLSDAFEVGRYKLEATRDQPTRFRPDEYHFNDKTLRQLPVLFGESDVMKGLQLLPGVSTGNDGTIGLNVRGGGPDQNLILLDDVPVYNPSHIYGFFSVFNSDVVRDVRLIKGGMGSKYSGRLSSVVDVRTIDGNRNKLSAQVSLGLLSSKLTLDGPLDSAGKTTFVLSGRRSYIDLLYELIGRDLFSNSLSPFRSSYFFYDANGKLSHHFSNSHQLSVSFYTGRDNSYIRNSFSAKDPGRVIREKDKQEVFWGNNIVSLRDNHRLAKGVYGRALLSFTGYNFGNESEYEYAESSDSFSQENAYRYRFVSAIKNTMASYHVEFRPEGNFTFRTGVGGVYHRFDRNIQATDNIVSNRDEGNVKRYATELNAYAETVWKPHHSLQATGGLHAVHYNPDQTSYGFLQPRISVNYRPAHRWLVHGAFQQTAQFLHLLTSNNYGIPLDLWLPSTTAIRPETSGTFSGGLSYFTGDFVFSAEAYHKTMNGLIEYREQANYLGSEADWEQKVEIGSGLAKGMEFLIEKRNGITKGWISYTISKNDRIFPGINNGKSFPYRYDRRHNLALLLSHEFSKRTDVSATWVYSTGSHYTLPEQVYYLGSGLDARNAVYIYGERNQHRLPDYHRLDLGVNFKKFGERFNRILSIGAYNVYNRLNPFYVVPAYDDSGGRIFEAVSLFPVLPSIHYKVQF